MTNRYYFTSCIPHIFVIFISLFSVNIFSINGGYIYQAPSKSSSNAFGLTTAEQSFGLDLTHNINIFELNIAKRFKTQQYYRGLIIMGATLVIEEDEDGIRTPLIGYWYDNDEIASYIPDINPSITKQEAIQIVLNRINITFNDTYGNITNDLCIYYSHRPYLVYNIQFLYSNKSQPNEAFQSVSIIEAFHPYNILKHHNQARTMMACGSGGNAKIGSHEYCSGGLSGLTVSYSSGTPTLKNSDFWVYDKGNYDWDSGNDNGVFKCAKLSSTQCNTDAYDYTVNGGYGAAIDVYSYALTTWAMYSDWMGESPILSPKPLPIFVHVGTNWGNANYVGYALNFGDGGTSWHPLGTCSITAHEVAHGYTDRYSDLYYYAESGGMNEAYSDIAGESAEYYLRGATDWKNGYDMVKSTAGPPYDALRYLYNPPLDGKSIDHWCSYYDELNVHYTSGPYNKVAYLMSVDSTYAFSMDKIFKIFSRANKIYWTKYSTYKEGVCGVLYALSDYYSAWTKYPEMETSVIDSFASVGLSCGGSSVDCGAFGIKCGSNPNKFCYYFNITPLTSSWSSHKQSMQAWPNDDIRIYFYVYITIYEYDCINPRLWYDLDRIDYDGYSGGYDEMIEVYDNDMSLIQRCTATDLNCYANDRCINSFNLNGGSTLTKGTTYTITIIMGADVDATCDDHDLTLNAEMTVTCAKVPTISPTPSPTAIPTKYPTPHPTDIPTPSPTDIPTSTPSDSPTQTPTNIPTLPPSTAPTLAPTDTPSQTPSTPPTIAPSLSPTNIPSIAPSMAPSKAPSLVPSTSPTLSPTTPPTNAPSLSPTIDPTISPSTAPSLTPSLSPSSDPTFSPTMAPSSPTDAPSIAPSIAPSRTPSVAPSTFPTFSPSKSPTNAPSLSPSNDPTMPPSIAPSISPTLTPTNSPTTSPSLAPSVAPSNAPSIAPSYTPTSAPSLAPVAHPTMDPTLEPTFEPTLEPIFDPTVEPTFNPTFDPTLEPTVDPTKYPSLQPSIEPTLDPTVHPTIDPTIIPTVQPTVYPTDAPSNTPTNAPSNTPNNAPSTAPTIPPSDAPSQSPSITTLPPTLAPSFIHIIGLAPPTKVKTEQIVTEPGYVDLKLVVFFVVIGSCICSVCGFCLLAYAGFKRQVYNIKKKHHLDKNIQNEGGNEGDGEGEQMTVPQKHKAPVQSVEKKEWLKAISASPDITPSVSPNIKPQDMDKGNQNKAWLKTISASPDMSSSVVPNVKSQDLDNEVQNAWVKTISASPDMSAFEPESVADIKFEDKAWLKTVSGSPRPELSRSVSPKVIVTSAGPQLIHDPIDTKDYVE